MRRIASSFCRLAPALAFALAAAIPATARDQAAPVATAEAPANWQHAGSDIPSDPAWRTGILPNGLRYAVRRNALPPGNIAIRLRVDVGAVMEADEQQGWAHLLEHMVFRGSKSYPDGEAVKIWQRLGASFGSDSNASTTLSATTYMLDLPKADAASYREAMSVLSEMMTSATLDPKLLDTERQVVLAERAARKTPVSQKIEDAAKPLFFAGFKAKDRDIAGTATTLGNATADRLRGFYKSWYRPERSVLVVVGDADPALLEKGLRDAFGGWKGEGEPPAEPDFGALAEPPAPAAQVSDPLAPSAVQFAWLAPHDNGPWTIARNQQSFVDTIAALVLSQRFDNEARKGGAIVNASAGRGGERNGADQFGVSVTPRPGAWKQALDQAFAVVNGALAAPPAQAEIDEQAARMRQSLAKAVTDRETAQSAGLASIFIGDVDDGDVTATRRYYLDLFDALRPTLTPALIHRSWRAFFAPAPRLLLLSPEPIAGGDAAVIAAFADARRIAGGASAQVRAVSIDELELPGRPGKVVESRTFEGLGIERLRFANGVTLSLKRTDFEKDRIRVAVQIGHGALNRAPGDRGLGWSSGALLASGFGPFSVEEVARVSAGRQIGWGISPQSDALVLSAGTDRRDLADALRMMAGGVTAMRYGPVPIQRLKDAHRATYQTIFGQPMSVLNVFGSPYLYSGDIRFGGLPTLEQVETVTLDAFRAYWSGQLGSGPIRVTVVGDFDREAMIAAVAASFGALPPRADDPPTPAELAVRVPGPAAAPVVLRHRGDADQAVVQRIWRLPGLFESPHADAFAFAATLVRTRLTEEFREQEGGSYSPFTGRTQPYELPGYGGFAVGAQLKVSRIADFDAAVDRILADLAQNGPGADALERARATLTSSQERAQTSNGYWMEIASDALDDPRVLARDSSWRARIAGVDAAAAKAAVAAYLKPGDSFAIHVLPEAKPAD